MRFAHLFPAAAALVWAAGAGAQGEVPPAVELDPAPVELPAPPPVEPRAPRALEVSGFQVVPRAGVDPGKPKGKPGDNAVSRSATQQFVVYAKESEVRGAFCVFAEQVKAELLGLLKRGGNEPFRYPIHIHVRGHMMSMDDLPPVRPSVRMTEGGGFSLQAIVNLGQNFTRDAMRKELVTLLLAERIVRAHPNVDFSGRKVLPDWLRIGISEGIEFRRRGRPTELFSAVYKSGRMLSVNEIVYARPDAMNSVSEKIYRASCCGFLLALTEQKHGSQRLNAMLGDLSVFEGTPAALLEKHFPGTGESTNSLEKWWVLELATIAQPTVKDILGPVETEEALGKCLQVRYTAEVAGGGGGPAAAGTGRRRVWQVFRPRDKKDNRPPGGGEARAEVLSTDLSDFRKYIDHPKREGIVSAAEVALLQLSYRAFPLHRPLIHEYQLLIGELRRGKTKGAEERFATLAAQRVELARAARDAGDYLLHYQATKVGRMSGAFEDYKAAREELDKPLPPRTDPLSKYLDDLDKVYR